MRTEPVSIDSSCSGVAVLHCGSGLMKQGTAPLETLNLTWRRNGEEIVPNSDTEVSQTTRIYQCVSNSCDFADL